LNSKLEQLSQKDPDADAKDSVLAWMELSRDPAMQEVVDMVKAGSQPAPPPVEPPPPAPAPAAPEQPMQEAEVDEGELGDMRDFFKTQPGIAPTPQVAARYRASEEDMAESLDADQKRVGQLGPKAKYAKKGDLVGTMESVDTGEYDARKSTSKGETTPEQEKEFRKKTQAYGKELEQRQKEKKKVKEGQEDLDAILRIIRK
jgi:hypothetical protein